MSKLLDVVKYDGSNDYLITKQSADSSKNSISLVVKDSQEAILVKMGKALDSYKSGMHVVDVSNVSTIKRLLMPFSKKDLLTTDVYFVNLSTQLGIKWGTDSKVRIIEPISEMSLEIGASGTFNLKVIDARKLLIKVLGTDCELNTNDVIDKSTTGKFKGMIVNKVKLMLAKTIKAKNYSIFELDEHLDELSEIIKNELNENLSDYGLTLPEFYITNIATPDDDPNFIKLKEQKASKYLKVQEELIRKEALEAKRDADIFEAETLKKVNEIKEGA